MPTDVLARTTFITTRYDDPKLGFQRTLDLKRAQDIANYIDDSTNSIPSAIVLSAQADAELRYDRRNKTIDFLDTPKAFLILDGQHRVYGFSLAKTTLRVPVVIYNRLSRADESRLFIDINTKQRPVPNELLLDIKNLANYETNAEALLRDVFDSFASDPASPLVGLLSPAAKVDGKLTRVTFNAALKPLISIFGESDSEKIYQTTRTYVEAFAMGLQDLKASRSITNPILFRAMMLLFPEVAQRVKDRFAGKYSTENFSEVLKPIFERIRAGTFLRPGASIKSLRDSMSSVLTRDFTL